MTDHEVTLADVPEWSCGAYVYDDVTGFEFSQEERIVDGRRVLFPVVKADPDFDPLNSEAPIAKLRFLRREDCPVHGDTP